jgi:hypothetical protein
MRTNGRFVTEPCVLNSSLSLWFVIGGELVSLSARSRGRRGLEERRALAHCRKAFLRVDSPAGCQSRSRVASVATTGGFVSRGRSKPADLSAAASRGRASHQDADSVNPRRAPLPDGGPSSSSSATGSSDIL